MFFGDFNTPLISTTAERSSYNDYIATYRSPPFSSYQINDLYDTVHAAGLTYDVYYRAELAGVSSTIKFVKFTRKKVSAIITSYDYTLYFYDINMNAVNIAAILTVKDNQGNTRSSVTYLRTADVTASGTDLSFYAVGGFTLRVFSGIDTITINIPSESEISVAGITTHGTMYYTTDGTLKMKL